MSPVVRTTVILALLATLAAPGCKRSHVEDDDDDLPPSPPSEQTDPPDPSPPEPSAEPTTPTPTPPSGRDPHADKRIVVYGAKWCKACQRLKKTLHARHVPFSWVDV